MASSFASSLVSKLKSAVNSAVSSATNAVKSAANNTSTATQTTTPKTSAVTTKSTATSTPATNVTQTKTTPATTTNKTSAVTKKSSLESAKAVGNILGNMANTLVTAAKKNSSTSTSTGTKKTDAVTTKNTSTTDSPYVSSVKTSPSGKTVIKRTQPTGVEGKIEVPEVDNTWKSSSGKTIAELQKEYDDSFRALDNFLKTSNKGVIGGILSGDNRTEKQLAKEMDQKRTALETAKKEKSLYDRALGYSTYTSEALAKEWTDLIGLSEYEDENIETYQTLINQLEAKKALLNPGYVDTIDQYERQKAEVAEIDKEIEYYKTMKSSCEGNKASKREGANEGLAAITALTQSTGYLEEKYGAIKNKWTVYTRLEALAEKETDPEKKAVLTMDMALLKPQAEYDKYLYYDIAGAEQFLVDAKAKQEELSDELNQLNADRDAIYNGRETVTGYTLDQIKMRIDQIGNEASTLQEQVTATRGDMMGAKSVQKLDPYYHLPEEKDFDQYSEAGAAIENTVPEQKGFRIDVGKSNWVAKLENPAKYVRDVIQSGDFDPEHQRDLDTSYLYMSDEEYAIYNYLLAKSGKSDAEKFHLDLLEVLNSRQGEHIAENIENANPAVRVIATAGLGASAGFEQYATGWRNTIRALQDRDPVETSPVAFASANVREGLGEIGQPIYDGKTLAQTLYDADVTVANMAPSILIGNMLAGLGAGLPAWAGTALSKLGPATMGISAGGNYYAEAIRNGYNKSEAKTYASLAGTSEAVLQDVIGGIASLGGIVPKGLSANVLANIDNAYLRMAAEIGVRDLSEGIEEWAQDVLTPVFYNIAAGEKNTVQIFNNKDATYSFLLACLTTTLLEGGNVYQNTVQTSKIGDMYSAFFNPQSDIFKTASQWDGEVGELANKIRFGDAPMSTTNLGKVISEFAARGEMEAVEKGILDTVVKSDPELFKQVYSALSEPGKFTLSDEAAFIKNNAPGKDIDYSNQQVALLNALTTMGQLTKAGWSNIDVMNPAVQALFSEKTGAVFTKDMSEEAVRKVFEDTAHNIQAKNARVAAVADQAKADAEAVTERIKNRRAALEKASKSAAELATAEAVETAPEAPVPAAKVDAVTAKSKPVTEIEGKKGINAAELIGKEDNSGNGPEGPASGTVVAPEAIRTEAEQEAALEARRAAIRKQAAEAKAESTPAKSIERAQEIAAEKNVNTTPKVKAEVAEEAPAAKAEAVTQKSKPITETKPATKIDRAKEIAEEKTVETKVEPEAPAKTEAVTPKSKPVTEIENAKAVAEEKTEQPKKKGRTAAEKAAAMERAYKHDAEVVDSLPLERAQYLKSKYVEHKDFVDSLKEGDELYTEDGKLYAKVTNVAKNGKTLEIYDGDGEVAGLERIPTGTFTADGLLSMLEGAGLELRSADGTSTVVAKTTPATETTVAEAPAATVEAAKEVATAVPEWYNESMGDLTDKLTYRNGNNITRQQWIERGMNNFGKTAEEANEQFNQRLENSKQSPAQTIAQRQAADTATRGPEVTTGTPETTAEAKTEPAKEPADLTTQPKVDKIKRPDKYTQSVIDKFNSDVSSPSDQELHDALDFLMTHGAVNEGNPNHDIFLQMDEEMSKREDEAVRANELIWQFRQDQGSLSDEDACWLYDYALNNPVGFETDIADLREEVAELRGYEEYANRVERQAKQRLSALGRAEQVRNQNGQRYGVGASGSVGQATGRPAGDGGVQAQAGSTALGGRTASTGGRTRTPVKYTPGTQLVTGTYLPKGSKQLDEPAAKTAIGEKLYDALRRTGLGIYAADALCDANGDPTPGVTVLGKSGDPIIYVNANDPQFSAPSIAIHEAVHQWMKRAFGANHLAKAEEIAKKVLKDAGISWDKQAALFDGYDYQYEKDYAAIKAKDKATYDKMIWEEILGDMIGNAPYSFMEKLDVFGKGIGDLARNALRDNQIIEKVMLSSGLLGRSSEVHVRSEALGMNPVDEIDMYGWTDDLLGSRYKAADRDVVDLTNKLQDYFGIISPTNPNWLSSDEIADAMEEDPYSPDGNIDAEQIMMNLSEIAKTQTGRARTTTYELMEALANRLSIIAEDNFIEKEISQNPDFTEWYGERHPGLYYEGYVPGDLKQYNNRQREIQYLTDYLDRGRGTEEDRSRAQNLLTRLLENKLGISQDTFYKARDKETLAPFTTETERLLSDPKSKLQGVFNKEGLAKADVLASQLRKLVKPQEMQWTGLNLFFDQNKGKQIGKQTILDFIADNNIQIEQTGYYAPNGEHTGEFEDQITGELYLSDGQAARVVSANLRNLHAEDPYGLISSEGVSEDADWDIHDYDLDITHNENGTITVSISPDYLDPELAGKTVTVLNEVSDPGTARWGGPNPVGNMGNYALDGGENYREYTYEYTNRNAEPYENSAMNTHFPRQSDLIGHARVQDFETPDGDKVLFVEEVQSDWSSAIRKNGLLEDDARYMELQAEEDRLAEQAAALSYQIHSSSKANQARLWPRYSKLQEALQNAMLEKKLYLLEKNGLHYEETKVEDDIDGLGDLDGYVIVDAEGNPVEETFQGQDGQLHTFNTLSTDLNTSINQAMMIEEIGEPAPNMPFGGDYYQFVLKDLLKKAVDGGYDYIAWATPQMQSERYYGDDSNANTYQEYKFDFRSPSELNQAGLKKPQAGPIQSFLNKYSNANRWIPEFTTITLEGAESDPGHNVTITDVPAMAISEGMKQSLEENPQPLFKASDREAAAEVGVDLDEAFPEGSFERTLLEMMRNGHTEAAQAYINGIINRPQTYTEEPNPTENLPVTDDELATLREAQEEKIERYGKLKPGEKAARDVRIAEKQNDETFTRRHAARVAEAEAVPEHTARALEKFIATDEAASYVRISDKEATNYADKLVKKLGIEKAMQMWDGLASPLHNPTKKDIALGETLALWAAHNGRDDLAMKIWADIDVMATNAGQVVQSMRMVKKMSPEYQAYYVRKVVDQLNANYSKQIDKGWKGMKEITINEALEDAVLQASTQEELDAAMDALISDIAKQIPTSLKEKWDSWRYFAMLGNPRTHVRNILGNAIFAPLVFGKNLLATGMEQLIPEEQRTKSLTGRSQYRDFANADFEQMKDQITGERDKYTNPRDAIMAKRKIWKTPKNGSEANIDQNANWFKRQWQTLQNEGVMNWATEFVGDALNTEDAWFLKPYYTHALEGYLAAHNANIEELQSTPEGRKMLNEARAYAMNEAQKATYRDASVVAQALNKLKKVPGLGMFINGVLPFTGTPVNILRRGIEYSPVGLIKTLTYNTAQLVKGNIDPAQYIDNLASGMTGSMVAALGFWLAAAGLIRGTGDDDDDKLNNFEKNKGRQNYALEFDFNGKPYSYTIDWAAPASLPLFVGVAANDLFSKDHEMSAADMYQALAVIVDPMTNLSMLDGLNKTLSSLSYADEDEMFSTLLQEMGTSYLGQAIPTLWGQIARTKDDTRRSSYTDKNSDVPKWIQYFIQSSVQNKIPVWEEDKMAYVDLWGRKETQSNMVLRAIENFLSPGYINEINVTPVDEELQKLYDATGASVILPSKASKYFSVEGERKDLTAKEFEQLCIESGQTKYNLLAELFNDKRYVDAPESVKLQLIEDMYKYANSVAKYHIDDGYNLKNQGKWIVEAESAENPYEAIMGTRYNYHLKNSAEGAEATATEVPVAEVPATETAVAPAPEQTGNGAPDLVGALNSFSSALGSLAKAGVADVGQQAKAQAAAPKVTTSTSGLSDKDKQAYTSYVQRTGVTEDAFLRAITDSNTDGNTNVKQEELGSYLNQQIRTGQLSNEQANAIWQAVGSTKRTPWSTSYDGWKAKGNNVNKSEYDEDELEDDEIETEELKRMEYEEYKAKNPNSSVTFDEWDDYISRGFDTIPRTGETAKLIPYATKALQQKFESYLKSEGVQPYDTGYPNDIYPDINTWAGSLDEYKERVERNKTYKKASENGPVNLWDVVDSIVDDYLKLNSNVTEIDGDRVSGVFQQYMSEWLNEQTDVGQEDFYEYIMAHPNSTTAQRKKWVQDHTSIKQTLEDYLHELGTYGDQFPVGQNVLTSTMYGRNYSGKTSQKARGRGPGIETPGDAKPAAGADYAYTVENRIGNTKNLQQALRRAGLTR